MNPKIPVPSRVWVEEHDEGPIGVVEVESVGEDLLDGTLPPVPAPPLPKEENDG